MANIKKWCIPETTRKAIYAGIYPAVISMAKVFSKEIEKDDVKTMVEIVSLTLTTLQEVPFPDQTNGKIVVEQQYRFDSQFHQNALNGIARAAGIAKLEDTDELEGKTVMVGIMNHSYEKDGETYTYAQLGSGLFTYAPISAKSEIKFMASDFPAGTEFTEDDYKLWFKENIALFKEPK